MHRIISSMDQLNPYVNLISIRIHFHLFSILQPIDTPFPEPSTSSGPSSRPGELYKMAGFSQDLPTSSYQVQSSSPQTGLQRFNTTSTNSSSSSSEIDMMRNRVLQMQVLAMTEKEVCLDHQDSYRCRIFYPIRHRNIGVARLKNIIDLLSILNKRKIVLFNNVMKQFIKPNRCGNYLYIITHVYFQVITI